jgi:ligand-binding sensor domain-containing protein
MKVPLLVLITFLFLILSSLHSQEGWHRLTSDDGLHSNKILTIYQAKNSDIWIGTDKGITRYNGVFEESSLSFDQ